MLNLPPFYGNGMAEAVWSGGFCWLGLIASTLASLQARPLGGHHLIRGFATIWEGFLMTT